MSDQQKRSETEYIVCVSPSKDGPWEVFGRYTTHGQRQAKADAARDFGKEAGMHHFIAVPSSSWLPQKPLVRTTLQISFLDAEQKP